MTQYVLAVVTDAWGGQGGIAQYNRDLLAALIGKTSVSELEVLVLHKPKGEYELPPGVRMSHSRTGRIEFAWRMLSACIEKPRPDVLFCGHINLGPVSAIIGGIFQIPLWLQVHGIDAWERPGPIRKWATERAALVTSVSRFTRNKLLSWANLDPVVVKVLPNTVSDQFSSGPKSPYLLDRFDLNGKKVLLTVGRLSATEQYKGHDQVISALPDLLNQDKNFRYLIVGGGDNRARLERQAHENGVEDEVIFAGHVTSEELPDYYRLADLFVMPSSGEGFGIAFLEALSSGVPVLGCAKNGSADPLREGELGTVFDRGRLEEAILHTIQGIKSEKLGDTAIDWFGADLFRHRVDTLARSFDHHIDSPEARNVRH